MASTPVGDAPKRVGNARLDRKRWTGWRIAFDFAVDAPNSVTALPTKGM